MNRIIKGDCIEVLSNISEETVDLIFADPPYNLQLGGDLFRPNQSKVSAVTDEWDQFSSFENYDNFTISWLTECQRVLKPNGSIWVIGSYHNIFRVGKVLQDLGFWILNDILWIKSNPMPNFKGTRFNNAHETLIWAGKNEKSKPTFHYRSMKSHNEDKQMRSDWFIPICSGEERLKLDGEKVHSTQKPEALLRRVILSSSNQSDLVLDPFSGSGTTAAVSKKLGRNFIGIEKEQKYIDASENRIKNIEGIDPALLEYPIDVRPPKVPFGNLLEMQLLKPGQDLFSPNGKIKAKILADATISYQDQIGSIHKISAFILDKEANNGWDYWHYLNENSDLITINYLRDKYIKEFM